MSRIRTRGEDVRRFVLEHLEKHPAGIAKEAASRFRITRQAVNKHLQKLVSEGSILEAGQTRNRTYKLAPLAEWQASFKVDPELAEDVVWSGNVSPALGSLPENVSNIWHYGFTEMFNNAIDHSGGSSIRVKVSKTAATAEMVLIDDGVGIFKKIQSAMNLLDERHAILELSKGKLTTDPRHHSGEGIFFTSRMFDSFAITSGGVFFSHQFGDPKDWILENEQGSHGTTVWMKLHNHTARTTKKIFDLYASGDDYGFNKTVVPVRLARHGSDQLISRSQAKRVLARVDLFKEVVFDFSEVDAIGQAFADEIFRVFPLEHPGIEINFVKANSQVKRLIERAKSGLSKEPG